MAQTININISESQPGTQTSTQTLLSDEGPPPTGGEVQAMSDIEMAAPAPTGSEQTEAAAYAAPGPEDFFNEEINGLNGAPLPDLAEMAFSDTSEDYAPMPDEFFAPEMTTNATPEPEEQPADEKKKPSRTKKSN